MILIDSIYINQGGGLVLLKRIIEIIPEEQRQKFSLLLDARIQNSVKIPGGFNEVVYLEPSFSKRRSWYADHTVNFKVVFALGNVPPPAKAKNHKIYTYCAQLFMFDRSMLEGRMKVRQWIRTTVIKALYKYSRSMAVAQTESMANRFFNQWKFSRDRVKLFPIFQPPNLSEDQKADSSKKHKITCLTYVYDYKGHYDLLEALKSFDDSFISKFQFTIDRSSIDESRVDPRVLEKVNFIGQLPHEEVMKEIRESKFVVHPSKAESFGLVLVECAEIGVPIICPDLPYVNDVISGAYIYKNNHIESMVDVIGLVEESHNLRIPTLVVEDKTEEFISFLVEENE